VTAVPDAVASDAHTLLDDLDPEQHAAVTSSGAPLCIVAGPGAGKTRVLTRRVGYRLATGSADAGHVLVITFTRKAATELNRRLGALGLRGQAVAGTFHAVALAQLRQRWTDAGTTPPSLLDRKAGLLAPLVAQSAKRGGQAQYVQPADVAAEIEWAKARMINPGAYAAACDEAGRRPPLTPTIVASIYERYERLKRERALIDFDDVLIQCARAMRDDRDFAAVQRWKFRHLFVDEFQDINPLQLHLLEAWRAERPDLCVVGDPDQAIYGWNGADVGALADFSGRYPGSTIVRLETNYRSTPQIVRTASRVLARRSRRTVQADGPIPSISVHSTDVAEAAAVARRIRDRRGPSMGWRHLAVLARTNAQLTLIEEALRAAQVPCRVRGGGSLLEQPEVKSWLRDPRHRGPTPVAPRLADLEAMLDEAADEALGNDPASGLTDERRRNLEELVRVGHEYLALDPTGTSVGFAEWLSATLRTDDISPDADAVDLVTFHRAKGLEWPVVVVTGLERGLVPIGQATTTEALEEETRLLYVALTRAERELYITWAEQRTFGTRQMNRSPSPLLAPIEVECEAMRQGSPETDNRASLRDARRTLDHARSGRPEAHSPLFVALKEWRLARARAAETPAYTIFDDKTLTAIVENEPRTKTALRAVPGIGPVKLERYGDEVLELVSAFVSSRST
jgi:DNA helicase-2/ATP-dependent DNA helicase PcrA